MSNTDVVTASDWVKGIALSVAASIIGAASKLAIRKSWLLEQEEEGEAMTEQISLHSSTHRRTTADVVTLCCGDDDDTSHVQCLLQRRPRGHLLTDETEPLDFDEDEEKEDVVADDDDDDIRSEGVASALSSTYDPETRRPRCSPSSWLAWTLRGSGMIGMSVLNPLFCVLAMNYASPSILAPFSGLTLVWIVLLSSPLIGEQPVARQVVAAALIVLGEVVVAIFGDHTNDEDVTVQDVVSRKGALKRREREKERDGACGFSCFCSD